MGSGVKQWAMPLVALIGCAPAEVVMVDVPNDVVLASLVELDEFGSLERASPLQAWPDSLPVVTRPDERVFLIGYTEAQLASYGVAVSTWLGATLVAAEGCRNALPTPAYAARIEGSALMPSDAAAVPRLSAALTHEGCGDFADEPWVVELSCAERACTVASDTVAPCIVELSVSGCDEGVVRVTQDPLTGRLCADVEIDDRQQCVASEDTFADTSVSCDGGACDVYVYRDARVRPRPFELERGQWRDGPARIPASALDKPWVQVRFLESGYALDMAVLNDHAVISSPVDPDNRCGTEAGSFYSVDLTSLATIAVEPGPPCAKAMSADPGGQTFVASYYDEPQWRIGRFDGRGRELVSVPLSDRFDDVSVWRPQQVLRPPGLNEIWLTMINVDGLNPVPGTALIRLDAGSLLPQAEYPLHGWGRSFSAVMAEAAQFALVTEWMPTVGWFAPSEAIFPTPSRTSMVPPDNVRNEYYSMTSLGDDRVIVAALGQAPALLLSGQPLRRAFHPGGGVEQAMVRFMPRPDGLQLGIGMQTINGGQREAIAVLLDPVAMRFRPGVWVIGDGFPTVVKTDDQGRIFVLLPWTAELVRLDPTRR